ncbi:DnaJ domain-containing protein, partial [Pavlovales sp. CCMP2436]
RDADPCEVLELDVASLAPPADEGALRKAYRAQCLRWHPDKHTGGSAEDSARAHHMFRRLSEAFELLSDEAKRSAY